MMMVSTAGISTLPEPSASTPRHQEVRGVLVVVVVQHSKELVLVPEGLGLCQHDKLSPDHEVQVVRGIDQVPKILDEQLQVIFRDITILCKLLPKEPEQVLLAQEQVEEHRAL